MRRTKALLFDFVTLASLLSVSACSSKGGSTAAADGGSPYGPCVAFVSVSDLSAPGLVRERRRADFSASNCTSGGFNCHGTDHEQRALSRLLRRGRGHRHEVLGTIVSVLSPEEPMMLFVAPGDPANSYLMHKMDADQCTLAAACAVSPFDYLLNCGNSMPNGAATLPLATRDTVRAWIAQGAANN